MIIKMTKTKVKIFRKKLIALITAISFTLQPMLVSAEVIVDQNASKNQPSVQTAQNGVPIVNIAIPSAAGLSHNYYQQFNVDKIGLIFNNSQVLSKTQLAGYIFGNPNLTNGTARIILNEVTSSNPSYLKGYSEIAGDKAVIIIANPNGIYGGGFGFINANRAILTTGTPVFGGTGSLDAFRVTGGQISIQDEGMNAKDNTDCVDLISRAVNINANMYANQLNVVTGANQVNYNTLNAHPITGDAIKPQVQIDIGQLGGMYAQKIYMVGTEKGVGVNSQGGISSTGDIDINSEGKVTLDKTSAGGNIAVTAKNQVINQSSLYAQGDITINTQVDFQNAGVLASGQKLSLNAQNISSTGSLGAGITSEGKVGSSGDLSLNANGNVTTRGQTIAAGNLSIQGAALDLSSSKETAGGNATLTATQGDINNNGGSIQTGNLLTASAQGNIHNDQDSVGGAQAQIIAGQLNLRATKITNQNSQITQTGTNDTSIIASNALNNTAGQIGTNGTNVNLQAGSVLNGQGKIRHAGTGILSIQTTGDLTNVSGKIVTNGQGDFIANNLDNTQGTITAQKQINATTQNYVKNQQGNIEANKGINVNAGVINNQNGKLLNLDSSDMKLMAEKDIQNQSGILGGNGDVNLKAQSLTNNTGKVLSQGTLTATVSQNIDNAGGTIVAQQNMTLGDTGTILTNAYQGKIVAGNNLSANTNILNNDGGTMSANQDVKLIAATINGTGTVIAGQDLNIIVNGDFTSASNNSVKANRDFNLTANNLNNAGSLSAVHNLNLNATNLTNNVSGKLQGGNEFNITASSRVSNTGSMEGKSANISAKDIINNGSIYGTNLTMTAGTIANNSDTALIATTQNTNLYTKTSLENKDGANIYSMGNVNIAGSQNQDINGKYTDRSSSVLNQSATIQADNDVQIYANDITNKKREFVTGQTVVSQTSYGVPGQLISRSFSGGGILGSESATYLTGQSVAETNILKDSPEGKILASRNILLDAGTINNNLSSILAGSLLNASADDSINNVTVGRTCDTTKYFKEVGHSWSTVRYYTYDTTWKETIDPITGVMTKSPEGVVCVAHDQYQDIPFKKDLPSSTTTEAITPYTSRFGGGKSVNIQARDVNNITVTPENVPISKINDLTSSGQKSSPVAVQQTISGNAITLPTNSMFKVHQEPKSQYLVETNPLFANYQTFISSDYMLNKLGLDPAKTMKQIGDGFYEQQLVREQVSELTGRYILNSYSSSEEQFKALMDNGTTFAKKFNLQVGVALTAEQMEQLTSDMVWIVEKNVNGQRALVPIVYLTHTRINDLKVDGALIAADTIQIKTTGDTISNGVIKANDGLEISANDIINRNGTITGGQVNLTADRNLTVDGGNVSAVGDITLKAGQNLEIGSTATTQRIAIPFDLTQKRTNVVSNIKAGGNANLSAGQDVTLRGVQVTAGKDLSLNANGNINITAVTDSVTDEKHSGYHNKDYSITKTDDETVIGTTLQGGNQVTVNAGHLPSSMTTNPNGGNINIDGSYVISDNGKVDIFADKDVTIKEVTEKHESLVVTHSEHGGFLSSTTTDTIDHSLINQVKGSTISGDTVTVTSGKDLTIQGSNVIGTKDVNLAVTNNATITSAKETGKEEHYREEKTSGIFSGGGIGFTIGSKSEKTTINEQTLDQVGSVIGSVDSNVAITAGNKVNSAGTTFTAGKDLNITGKDVTLDNTINTVDSQSKYEFKQNGLSVSLGGGAVTAASNVVGDIKRSSEVEDARLKDLYTYKVVGDIKDLGKSKGDLSSGVAVSVSIGRTKTTSEQTSHAETVNTSNVNAVGNVNVTATEGDLNLKGTKINAVGVTLDAKKNLNIEGAENKQQTGSNTRSSSWAVGASVGLVNKGVSYFGDFNAAKDNENEEVTTNTESVVNASGNLTLNSGKDTNIDGSRVKGDKVVADIKGDLNIASKQDTDNYTASNESSGIGFSTEKVAGKTLPSGISGPINKATTSTSITGSLDKGKTDSTYASVLDQAGIFAGKGGFDIEVGKNTDLKGAVISSDATPDKNKLSTDTLTFSNMENRAQYNSSNKGVIYNSEPKKHKNDPAQGFSPDMGMPSSGSASSQTKPGVAEGTIIIKGDQKQDLSALNRDVKNLVNSIGRIFDKKSIQEKQEIAALFGKEASTLIGDIGEKYGWKDGGAEKTALHGLFGALSAKIGGGDAGAGGIGAGFNELVMQEISKLKTPALREWASFIVGASAARIFGHDALTGGTTASWETRYNRDGHDASDQSQIIQVIVYDSNPAGHAEIRIGKQVYSFAAYNEADDSSGTMVEGRGVVKVYDNADDRIISRLQTSNAYAYTLDVNDAEYWSIKNQFESIIGSGNQVNVATHTNETPFTAYQFNQDSPLYRYAAWGQNCTTFAGLNLYQGLKNGGGNPAEGLSTVEIPLQFRMIMQNWQSWSNMILYSQYLPKWNK